MSFNLAVAIQALISNNLVNKASSFSGESEIKTNSTVNTMVPIIIGGLANKTATIEGANTVANLAKDQYNSGVLDKLHSFFEPNNESTVNNGSMLVKSIFGENVNGLTSILSNHFGLKTSSISSLLAMVTPMVLAFVGKDVSANHLNATGLANMLSGQKNNITNALPTNLNLGGILGSAAAVPVAKPIIAATLTQEDVKEGEGKSMKLLLPLLLLLVLTAGAVWYFMGYRSGDKTTIVSTDTSAIAIAPISHVDTSGNYIYDLGKMVTIDLPNNAGKITVGENSTENKLYLFLNDANAKIDTVKGNWFEFTNVHFKTGGSEIDSASSIQLTNIVAISKAFPKAQFKLGGYTDNTGDSSFNIALSQKRAELVEITLKKLGAAAATITGAKGFGPIFPIGDNATADGKAMNRRVALNVKAK